jgi:hypothetical protein
MVGAPVRGLRLGLEAEVERVMGIEPMQPAADSAVGAGFRTLRVIGV